MATYHLETGISSATVLESRMGLSSVPTPPWKVLDFFPVKFPGSGKSWKMSLVRTGKSWKLEFKVLESPGIYLWFNLIITNNKRAFFV